ncbi:MAG: multicopper oxidase domain-containing protein [Rhizobiales bacterium]|nr:multicopper oxidase domain-containing protein [Hyphomicrobiales bacterium]
MSVAFDADNPGRWAFQCHNLPHGDRHDDRSGLDVRENEPTLGLDSWT